MKKILFLSVIIVVLLGVLLFVPAPTKKPAETPGVPGATSPENSSYIIEGGSVTLVNGRLIQEAAPGSTEEIDTKIFGQPVMGDLDLDGDLDAVVLLQRSAGGTGMFYYLAVATKATNGYHGSNALFIGDRIAPQTIAIQNGVAIANYADRAADEPFSTPPSIGKSFYAQLIGAELNQINVSGEGVALMSGLITYGGEVRTFQPCSFTGQELWVMGDSPAYKEIFDKAAALAATAPKPYTPVFAVLVGKQVAAPTDGFGADYSGGFYAMQLVKFIPSGSCQSQ